MFEGHDECILASLDMIDTDILSECLIIDCLVWYSRQTRQSGSKTSMEIMDRLAHKINR